MSREMGASGSVMTQEEADALRHQYGLDQPLLVQYAKWMILAVQGNFGMSMEWHRSVYAVIGDRLLLTMVVSIAAILTTWICALPIGIYSAVRQHSVGDYVFTLLGFIGLAVPSFLIALVLMYVGFRYFGTTSVDCFRRSISMRRGVGAVFATWPGICRCLP